MTAFESIWYMIWRGIAIGVLISAPMGPVGILCIQRTLDKGKKAGFYTGIGAAISDMVYCLLTGFGLSFIEDFINDNQNIIQLIGSVALIAFAIYLFKKNPSDSMRRPLQQSVSAKNNITYGFGFTFLNPLIIFLIIGLFARFNFLIPEIKGGFYAIGYIFIAVGALGWWYGITYVINKVRKKFNLRAMKIMNIIIGIVILGFACVGIISSILGLTSTEAKAADHIPYRGLSADLQTFSNASDTLLLIPLSSGSGTIDFKLANYSSSPMKRYKYEDSQGKTHSASLPPWHLCIVCEADTLTVTSQIIEHSPSSIDSAPAAEFTLSAAGVDCIQGVIDSPTILLTDGLDFGNGWNSYRLSISEGRIALYGGNRKLRPIFEIPYTEVLTRGRDISPLYIDQDSSLTNALPESRPYIFLVLSPGASVALRDLKVTHRPSPQDNYCSIPMAEIEQRLRVSSDPLEREWQLLDINLNSKYIAEGGDYRLAIIKAPDSSYELVYLSGAAVNASSWKPGMLKGRLRPSGIEGVYDLTWYDALGIPLAHHLKARATDGGTLLLQFPYHDSTLTLAPR